MEIFRFPFSHIATTTHQPNNPYDEKDRKIPFSINDNRNDRIHKR